MDTALQFYLRKNKIEYTSYNHPAVFTVEEHKKFNLKIPGMHTKNLFLKDENKKFYLVCMLAEKRLNTKILKSKLGVKEIHFASPEELKEHLNLTPGSVSIFGMIYSNSVSLILDKSIWEAESSGFHPNENTSTLVITNKNLSRFYNSLSAHKEIMEFA